MAIKNRNLEAGTKLISKYKKEEHRAEVIAGEGDKIMYRLKDGREFKSPSGAGTAITGRSCNGWDFWTVESDSTQSGPEEPESPEEHGKGEEPEGAETFERSPTAGFRRVPNQRGVGEGEVRLYCDACKASFTAPVDQQPETCPEGHGPDAGEQEVAEA